MGENDHPQLFNADFIEWVKGRNLSKLELFLPIAFGDTLIAALPFDYAQEPPGER